MDILWEEKHVSPPAEDSMYLQVQRLAEFHGQINEASITKFHIIVIIWITFFGL